TTKARIPRRRDRQGRRPIDAGWIMGLPQTHASVRSAFGGTYRGIATSPLSVSPLSRGGMYCTRGNANGATCHRRPRTQDVAWKQQVSLDHVTRNFPDADEADARGGI